MTIAPIHKKPAGRGQGFGIALMVAGMFVVPLGDSFAKILSREMAPFQISFFRYGVQTLLLVVLLSALRRPIITPGTREALPKLILSGIFMAFAAAFLFWGLKYLPLANTIAIFFVAPLLVTLFSAVFLGERVGSHRLGAVVFGLIGALIIIRPNWAHYGWHAILPLTAATMFAGIMVTMRSMSSKLEPAQIQTVIGAFAALTAVGLMLLGTVVDDPVFAVTMPTPSGWLFAICLGVTGTVFHLMFGMALKYAEASVLAPFQYVEIIGATLLGYLIFNEFPDRLTILGTVFILSAGCYVIYRERKLAARHRAQIGGIKDGDGETAAKAASKVSNTP